MAAFDFRLDAVIGQVELDLHDIFTVSWIEDLLNFEDRAKMVQWQLFIDGSDRFL
ncbi:hypothetical protein DSCW_32290 [Desulfosarcina widdelii]|uniref:Uncharacterized protein n=1 Tax=Desulfosarcina widdelii TaxID=947919 RepID=A0A5K7Z1G9_9BACT|nr:hypothetical protein DSCW_32290 [Desulfosarcina widdelii]